MNEEIIKRMYAKDGMFKFVVGAPDGRGKGIAGQKNFMRKWDLRSEKRIIRHLSTRMSIGHGAI